ncbi:MAG TPA: hypothetical protein VD835_18135, partial [Pyrinomonadaceae bacterium]|nr:hypothetical protein [Pyrinomonadaceae bacterium]
ACRSVGKGEMPARLADGSCQTGTVAERKKLASFKKRSSSTGPAASSYHHRGEDDKSITLLNQVKLCSCFRTNQRLNCLMVSLDLVKVTGSDGFWRSPDASRAVQNASSPLAGLTDRAIILTALVPRPSGRNGFRARQTPQKHHTPEHFGRVAFSL